MNKTISPTLRKTFSEILGDMAFIFVADPEEEQAPGEYSLQARISYTGARAGTVQLRCDVRFASLLAANLLGVDVEDPAAAQGELDSLKELMNVVCGHLVTAKYGTDGLFELSMPEVTPVPPDDQATLPEGAEVYVMLAEEFPIEVSHWAG